MKLRLISEELYLDQDKTIINVVEAENGVSLITVYVAELDENNKPHPLDVVKCVVRNELYDYDIDYVIDAFKLLFKHPSFQNKVIRFNDDDDDNRVVDALVANGLLVRVDGGFVLGSSNEKYRLDFDYEYVDKHANANKLEKVVECHIDNHGGERWFELEKLFKSGSQHLVILFKYLNNIDEKWPVGNGIANNILRNNLYQLSSQFNQYFNRHSLSMDQPPNSIDPFLDINDKFFEFNDSCVEYINNNAEAQKIVAEYGLRIYLSIANSLLQAGDYRHEESIRLLFNHIIESKVGIVIKITQKFYKVPDLNHLANIDKNILMRFKAKVDGWLEQ